MWHDAWKPVWTFIDRQLLGKHVPAVTNKQATIEVLLSYNDGNGVFCWIHDKKTTWRLHIEIIKAKAFRTLLESTPYSKVSV
jgi:hypothetical protein